MSVVSIAGYDFKAARQRQQVLIGMYRDQKRAGAMNPELEIEFMALIEEIDMEISEAHKSVNGRMTTARNSGHSVVQFGNVYSPNIAHWQDNVKEAAPNA